MVAALADSNQNIPKEPASVDNPAKRIKLVEADEKVHMNVEHQSDQLPSPAVDKPAEEKVEQQSAQVAEGKPDEKPSIKVEAAPAYEASERPCLNCDDKLLVKKLSDNATLPKRGSAYAAGYDLASAESVVVPARGKALIKTDLAIRVPKGTYGRVAPRSGLAVKNFIDTGAGVVDEDYRGNVGVLLFNHSDVDFQVNVGDRIAQLVLEKIATPVVEVVEDLDATERGANGYGSTGVSA